MTKALRLGPGLVQRGERLVATRAGMLRYRPPCSYWVESNGRRYCARVEDQVLGIVEDRMGECYRVSIFGRHVSYSSGEECGLRFLSPYVVFVFAGGVGGEIEFA